MSAQDESAWWLDARHPHEPEIDARQQRALLDGLAPAPRRVLELGGGAGRITVPLAAAGHDVVAIDHDAAALDACQAALETSGAHARLVTADFTNPWPALEAPFDAVLLLGNTMMTVADVDVAVDVLTRAADHLAPTGVVLVDDLPADFWPEVTDGNWLTGISPDGDSQLAWAESDTVFAWRRGAAVDPASSHPRAGEVRYRLWTDGALRLVARAAGLSGPRRVEGAHLLALGRRGFAWPAVEA